MKKKIHLYARFERFWHWLQSILIFLLLATGFEIHGLFTLMGFARAHMVHLYAAWLVLGLTVFAIFWHLTTGEWRQYMPTMDNLVQVIRYYLVGIFKGETHPHRKTRKQKLNPLQRLVYLKLKVIILPVQFLSGLWYYFYNELPAGGLFNGSLRPVALIHTLTAFVLVAFLVVHIYMSTTGGTLLSYIKAMITGWEEVDH